MGSGQMEKVGFTTEDGFKIYGNFWKGGKKAVLLLHQFQLDKASYSHFAKPLNDSNENFTVLAIDLRGHGESLGQNGKKRAFTSFSGQDFGDMRLDAEAAKKFLAEKGFTLYAVVGSSIGANTALNFAASDPSIKKAVLLSPGLNFKGIETGKSAQKAKAEMLCVSTPGDAYSFSTCKSLQVGSPKMELKTLEGSSHGTRMFEGTNLESELVDWLGK